MNMLQTERLTLRPPTSDDAESIEALASDVDIAKTTLNIPHPYPKGSAKTFVSTVLEAEKAGKLVIYAIEKKTDGALIGMINLNIQSSHKRGELAYWIGKPYWGKGYGTEAAETLIKYGFEKLHLNKIFAASFTNNPGSWKIMEKIGMKYEGTLRQHVMKWGSYVDLAYYGILKEEYDRQNSKQRID
ncbi:GNAT family N-acetyltransferase [Bacillus chungangensis]|uniref:RimJ/RimL family protein N-acetyltransferase n=1 Tax=Bacillus chungangensis TaxID=587633 RepID=A0ABT9WY29_9BACI|nr:GNAT family protein [Bacillus chungangensis]MDQ0178154.1 RimJ/RimL family protein N-acetyltransferase [Bacillus chungangensis]